MLPLSNMPNFSCKIITVKAAFLQSHFIDKEIFLEPFEEYQSQRKFQKLNKAAHEYTDASRKWFESVKDAFLSVYKIISVYMIKHCSTAIIQINT